MDDNARTGPINGDAFRRHVEQVLDNFDDHLWLGANSPLAQPYVLGVQPGTGGTDDDAEARGRALALQVRRAAATISTKEAKVDLERLLKASYLDRDRALNLAGVAVRLGYPGDTKTFYNHRTKAVSLLCSALIELLKPALRTERVVASQCIGREVQIARLSMLAADGRSVALTGPSGVGKTALLHQVAGTLPPDHAFAFTFRRGYNDHVASLLFALAAFLSRHGQHQLWAQLIASGRVNPPVALALIDDALHALAGSRLLLCFDEVDLLFPSGDEPAEYASLRSLLEALAQMDRAGCGLILAGQQAIVETDDVLALEALDDDAAGRLLAHWQLHLAPDEARMLSRNARGNPLLLKVLAGLRTLDGNAAHVPDETLRSPTVPMVLARIRRKLSGAEVDLLGQLAVFREYAPADAWPAESEARLASVGLVERMDAGRIALVPALRGMIYAAISDTDRARHHHAAATVLAARAQFTEAAFHLVRAGEQRLALWLWSTHRAHEIAGGRAAAALEVLQGIARIGLDDPQDADELARLQSELFRYAGNIDLALQASAQVRAPSVADSLARGNLLRIAGQHEAAIATLRDAVLAARAEQPALGVDLRLALARVYRGRSDFDSAWAAVREARHSLEDLEGSLCQMRGDYAGARAHYEAAHAIAKASLDAVRVASSTWSLARLNTLTGNHALALQQYADAEAMFDRLGDAMQLMAVRSDHSAVLILCGDHLQAAQVAGLALDFARVGGATEWIARTASNLAEAQLFLGKDAAAKAHASLALDQRDVHVKPYALRVLAQISHQSGDTDTALQQVGACIAAAQATQDAYAQAVGLQLQGMWMAGRDPLQAEHSLKEARALFEQLEMKRELAEVEQALYTLQGAGAPNPV